MTFVQLYTDELTRELGSADRATLFSDTRRKAAINAAQLEFVKRTECFTRQTSVALVDATQEYDLDAISNGDFGWISKQGISIQIVSGSTTRYIEGDDLEETSVAALQVEEPGWRGFAKGTPRKWYLRVDGGTLNLGLYPKPYVAAGETWTAIVPYWCIPADLSGDTDVPFSISGNPANWLRPYHRALVHFAAFDLEKFRKDINRGAAQLQLFEAEVAKYGGNMQPKQGAHVHFATRYRSDVGRRATPRRFNPRAYP